MNLVSELCIKELIYAMPDSYPLAVFASKPGFVCHWLVLGPFPNETEEHPDPALFDVKKSKGWNTDWLLSAGGETGIRPEAGQAVEGPGGFSRVWTPLHVKYFHWTECFRYYLQNESVTAYINENCKIQCWDEWDVVTYLACCVNSSREQQALAYASGWDGFKLWHNGALIGEEHTYHHGFVDHKKFACTLARGANLFLAKCDRRNFCLRFTAPGGAPLTGVRVSVPNGRNVPGAVLGENPFSPVDTFRKIAATHTPLLACSGNGRNRILAWQKKFRKKLFEFILPGGLPRGTLQVTVLERVDEGEFTREKISYTRPGSFSAVPAWVLTPKKPCGGAMVCLHGHGVGKDLPAGVQYNPGSSKMPGNVNPDYARKFARRGYVTITPDAVGFGERREPWFDNCNELNLRFNLLGRNMFGLDLFDYMGAVDYLHLRREVDPRRIGCAGVSFGGTSSYLLAALDKRIACAITSCAVTSFREYLQENLCCGSQALFGIFKYGDISDILSLIAPRPLLIQNGTFDYTFSLHYAQEAFEKVKKVYAALGGPACVEADFFEGGHIFHGETAFAWADRWLA